jgi:aryl-alcohol dehydrogenase-like predicted oxidoreductase
MMNRRELLGILGALPLAGILGPGKLYAEAVKQLPRRTLGRTERQVVALALGGIGSLAHPAQGMDAADIAVRAIHLGIDYLDTSNVYGPSQRFYGEAFRRLHLTPDDPHYDRAGRERLYVATKTMGRFSNQPNPMPDFPKDPPPGFRGTWPPQLPAEFRNPAIVDLKRSLTQMFGDGKGYIPEGAYIDCIQIHSLSDMGAVDMIYEGLSDRGSKMPERIGALAGLLDYRGGTNYTGLNPERRIYVKHIGITGHTQSPVLMRAIRRDTYDVIDTLLVSLNANDRLFGANQNNVLPLAMARGMGVIAMKVFADGAMYGGPKRYLSRPEDVIQTVGKPGAVPSADLVRYAVSLPTAPARSGQGGQGPAGREQ